MMMKTEGIQWWKAGWGRVVPGSLLVLAALTGCGGGDGGAGDGRPAELPEVRVHRVAGHEFVQRRSWNGTLAPLRSVTVQAPLTGRVAELLVEAGGRVGVGARVVRLEAPELEAREAVQAERLALAEEEWNEWRRLGELNAAGAAEVNAARLQWLEAREQSDQLAGQLEGREVRAPVVGRLVEWLVRPFSEVTQGQELAVLEDLGSIGVRLVLPAREAEDLGDGAEVRLVAGDLGELAVDGLLVQAGENGFVTVELTTLAEVAGPREVEVVRERRTKSLLVPWTAVASDGDDQWLAVVTDNGEIERRMVQLGQVDAAGVEVVEGLTAGEMVVIHRPRSLAEGTRVRAWEESEQPEDEA